MSFSRNIWWNLAYPLTVNRVLVRLSVALTVKSSPHISPIAAPVWFSSTHNLVTWGVSVALYVERRTTTLNQVAYLVWVPCVELRLPPTWLGRRLGAFLIHTIRWCHSRLAPLTVTVTVSVAFRNVSIDDDNNDNDNNNNDNNNNNNSKNDDDYHNNNNNDNDYSHNNDANNDNNENNYDTNGSDSMLVTA